MDRLFTSGSASYRGRLRQIFAHAEAEGYAVPSFNYNELWELVAIVKAAHAERAPALVAASAYRLLGIDVMAALGRVAMERQMGVFCHLDHAAQVEECIAAVDAGFASVMIDGSALSLDQNIALTRQVVDYAHSRNVFVEGELGRIGGQEDGMNVASEALARTEGVVRFVRETGVDSLAIAIGNVHGFYKAAPALDFELVGAVKRAVPVPPCKTSGTGIPAEGLQRTIRLGMRKVNIGTILHRTYVQGLEVELQRDPSTTDIAGLFAAASEPIVEVVRNYIRLCGASGRLPALFGEIR
jgi:fructose-bisphosphate aldolase class II